METKSAQPITYKNPGGVDDCLLLPAHALRQANNVGCCNANSFITNQHPIVDPFSINGIFV